MAEVKKSFFSSLHLCQATCFGSMHFHKKIFRLFFPKHEGCWRFFDLWQLLYNFFSHSKFQFHHLHRWLQNMTKNSQLSVFVSLTISVLALYVFAKVNQILSGEQTHISDNAFHYKNMFTSRNRFSINIPSKSWTDMIKDVEIRVGITVHSINLLWVHSWSMHYLPTHFIHEISNLDGYKRRD